MDCSVAHERAYCDNHNRERCSMLFADKLSAELADAQVGRHSTHCIIVYRYTSDVLSNDML